MIIATIQGAEEGFEHTTVILNSSMNLKFSSNASREIKYSKSLKININF